MKIYVLSRGEQPVRLFFDEHTAFEIGKLEFERGWNEAKSDKKGMTDILSLAKPEP